MKNTYVAIMAGGAGTSFWPVSRDKHPKQFIAILGKGKSLLRLTFERFEKICPQKNIYIVTNEKYLNLVKKELPKISEKQILLEPVRKNTAPCIAYVAHKIETIDPNANMVIAPSDHIILNVDVFNKAVKSALSASNKNEWLLTLGVNPTRPDVEYGYIQYIKDTKTKGIHKVKTFTEKPTLELAKTFLKSGDFLWNSGMFIWNVRSILKAFQDYLPEMYDIFQGGVGKYNTKAENSFIRNAYPMCNNISIDYGIMEKASNVYVIPVSFGWSDLGTWSSLYEKLDKDYLKNAVIGKNVMIYDSNNCIVHMPDDKLVILQGLENFIVIESDNILLISPKTEEKNMKQILTNIKRNKGDKYL